MPSFQSGARDQKAGAGDKAKDQDDQPGGEFRAQIMQLISRANRWNGEHADFVSQFKQLTGGDASAVAVMKWQRGNGLKVDGCVGPQTIEVARKLSGDAPAADGAQAPAGDGAQAPAGPAGGAAQAPADEAQAPGGAAQAPAGQAADAAQAPAGDAAQAPAGDAAQAPQADAAQAPQGPQADAAQAPAQSMAGKAGKVAGEVAGDVVTEGLGLIPSWDKPVLGPDGKPVEQVPGAEKVGDHDIEKRHQEVVGPEITALAEKIPPGILHDFVAGFGEGATEAPGDSYRTEAGVEDALKESE